MISVKAFFATAFQLLFFVVFVICYVAAILPVALFVAIRRPVITPGSRLRRAEGVRR